MGLSISQSRLTSPGQAVVWEYAKKRPLSLEAEDDMRSGGVWAA